MYENIKTVKELLNEVTAHGLSLAPEDIAKAQDIVGHAPVGELIALARDNGRRNKNGEPDPDGPWSSGSDGTQQRFISLLFNLWHWEDAVRFYNEHVNPVIRDMKAEQSALVESYDLLSKNYAELLSAKEAVDNENVALYKQLKNRNAMKKSLQQDLKAKEQTILELKANLYDLITEKEH